MDFKTIGWQDIVLNVPIKWEMIFATKSPKKKEKWRTGYFGFRTSSSKLMEIRWLELDQKKKPDLIVVIEDYFKAIKKKHKKIKKRTESETKVNQHDARTLYWVTEDVKIHGYMVVWECDELNRLIILQSQFLREEATFIKTTIMEILERLNCHPQDYQTCWTVPNLSINTPTSMKLVKQTFLVGLSFFQLHYHFIDLFCYRLGLANQKIDSFDELPEWFIGYYPKRLPGIPSGFKPLKEYFKKTMVDKKTIWRYTGQLEPRKISILNRDVFQAFFWQNVEKNDIYCLIFKYQYKYKDSENINSTLEKIVNAAVKKN